jgi:hypothetical protein
MGRHSGRRTEFATFGRLMAKMKAREEKKRAFFAEVHKNGKKKNDKKRASGRSAGKT